METITVYRFRELSEEAQERAIETEKDRRTNDSEVPWMEETVDSMKAVFEHTSGIKLTDWNIGPYNQNNFVRFDFDEDEAGDLSGKRAWAWLENNLFCALRIPYKGKERWRLAKYGEWYRAGMIKPCPLTGYCADDDFLDSLRKAIKDGYTIKDAFTWLADEAQTILEKELEYYESEEAIREWLMSDDDQYCEDGNKVYC